jgi:hypothetical protein
MWGRAFTDRFRLYHLLPASATFFSGKLLIFKDETVFGVKQQKPEISSQKSELVEVDSDLFHSASIERWGERF